MPLRIRDAAPADVLHRIGRAPDPLAWPPPRPAAGNNRFDDPENRFRVLYVAEQRLACFVETLAGFRASLELLAALRRVRRGTADDPPLGRVPDDWFGKRLVAMFALAPGQRWLDLRSLETRAALRRELAPALAVHDTADFDLGDALSRNRPLTQAIARWADEGRYSGIVYNSRFDCDFDCWALFDRARLLPHRLHPIAPDDLDLTETARLFDLSLPSLLEQG